MKRTNRTVVRVVVVSNQHGDWFGHENDRHNVGELLQVISHARPDAIFLHAPNGEPQDRHVFDVLPPPNMERSQEQNWAKMESDRLASFGYNAVPAPEWKE